LIEIVILPLEFVLDRKTYAKLNRYIMGFLFCLPLCIIATWESYLDKGRHEEFLALLEEPDEYQDAEENPDAWHGDNDNGEADDMGDADEVGKEISKVKFEDLKKKMPNLEKSVTGDILWQVSLPLSLPHAR